MLAQAAYIEPLYRQGLKTVVEKVNRATSMSDLVDMFDSAGITALNDAKRIQKAIEITGANETVNGVYIPAGEFRGAEVYFCEANKLYIYLSMNPTLRSSNYMHNSYPIGHEANSNKTSQFGL